MVYLYVVARQQPALHVDAWGGRSVAPQVHADGMEVPDHPRVFPLHTPQTPLRQGLCPQSSSGGLPDRFGDRPPLVRERNKKAARGDVHIIQRSASPDLFAASLLFFNTFGNRSM